jgi:hypothetical protein
VTRGFAAAGLDIPRKSPWGGRAKTRSTSRAVGSDGKGQKLADDEIKVALDRCAKKTATPNVQAGVG